MVYLHKSVFQSHGHLSSANCHVDSRWVLKISGFALHAFRMENDIEQVNHQVVFLLLPMTVLVCVHLFISCKLQTKLQAKVVDRHS